jgi:hypothetical protein
VLKLLGEIGWTYGSQAAIARRLRVSAATISRDMAVLLPVVEECPTCHQFRLRRWWADDWAAALILLGLYRLLVARRA